MEWEQKKEFIKKLETLSITIMNDSELEKKWLDFVQTRKEDFINSLFPFKS